MTLNQKQGRRLAPVVSPSAPFLSFNQCVSPSRRSPEPEEVYVMKLSAAIAIATTVAVSSTAALSSPNDANAVAEKLTTSMEKFYGKPIGAADNYLAQQFGVAGPIKHEGSSYVYMVPAKSPFCGELKLELNGETISSWQTITWQRSDEHQPGRACEQAFKQKLGSL